VPPADVLQLRGDLLEALRRFFRERGFCEVETPILVRSPGMEPHLRAVRAGVRYLITSPEYHMKRLLAAGMKRIFQITRCFREDERGPHHAREFTMLEWYRADAGYEALMDDCDQLLDALRPLHRGPASIDAPCERLAVAEAFARHAVGDPFELAEDEFFRTLVERIEPAIASRPTILYEWPARYAALARLKPGDPAVALRFELYAGGLELANAFDELGDAVEQRRRLLAEQALRRERGLEEYPIDERFLEAVGRVPPAAGIALGVDRLVMLLAGATDIRDVQAFSEDDA
jgi:elongation factor P--(R)-beta-lysine ligase